MDIILSAAWQITGVILFLLVCIAIGLNLAYPEWAEYNMEEEKKKEPLIYVYKK